MESLKRSVPMTDRSDFVRRLVTAGAVVLTAGFLACRENPADVPPTGNMVLQLAVEEGVSFSTVDQVLVRLSRSGAADINFTLQNTSVGRYEGTRQSLEPGTYTVTIRGLAAGEVEFFGETTADVQAGVDATVNITLTSFVPAIDPIATSTSVNFTASWPAVAGAESYSVAASSDPNFLSGNFSPDSVTDAGGTINADFTAPAIGIYYIGVRTIRNGIETGQAGIQTASVVTAQITPGNLASSTIAAANQVEVFGVTAAAGTGMSVLAFQTGVSTVDLDVTIGPVNGGRVGGNHDLGVLPNSTMEWIVAYESPVPAPALASGLPAIILWDPVQEPNPEKLAKEISPVAAAERLRSMSTHLADDPGSAPAAAAGSATDERTIDVTGAGGTTGDYDVFYHNCSASETAIGESIPDSLTTSDCFTFNPISGNLTYGKLWVFDGAAGDTLALELTSSVIDVVLFLFDDNGNLIGQNDDVSGTDSRLILILPSAGRYIAFTGSYDELAVGPFTITLNRFAPAAAIVNYVDVTPSGTTLERVLVPLVRLTAQPFDSTDTPISGRTISWFSFNDKVATVDGSGLVTAQGNGQTTIVAVADNEFGGAVVNVLDGGLTPVIAWTPEGVSPTDTLFGVWGTGSDDFFTVGLNGAIFHNDGTGWTAQASGTSLLLYGVWGLSSTDIYAVGADGTILYNSDGATWNNETNVTTDTLLSVWGTSWDDVWAVGSNGRIVHYDGGSWNVETSPVARILLGVWGTSVDNVFAVGAGGTIIHFDGASWTQMTSPTVETLRAVWGTAPDDVFAVGTLGTILHYDGATWTAMTSPTTSFLRAVWGSSGTDVIAVGNAGTILRFDGTSWAVQTSGTTEVLRGVWGAPEPPAPGVFAVGNSGTVLRGAR